MKGYRENASEKLHNVFNKYWFQVDEKHCKKVVSLLYFSMISWETAKIVC